LLLEVVLCDVGLVPGERLAAFTDAELRTLGPRRAGEAVDDVLERGERALDRLLVAVGRRVLREVGEAAMVLGRRPELARRVHAIEVAVRGDRLGVPL